jgi:UDP-N-acetylglucosamine 2-epimerase (non-hydrolysing)
VNSTLACALVASKRQSDLGCRIAHVEAGLRSGDRRMPEEVNRILTDRISDLLLIPSRDAEPNLMKEGASAEQIVFVGNVMIDTLFQQLSAARELGMPERLSVSNSRYALVTLHRPSNVDDAEQLANILEGLALVTAVMPVVFPIHPRTLRNVEAMGLSRLLSRFVVSQALGYREMLSLTDGASVVLTDSGGIQEETTALGVPCVTLREQTERPVTITEGTNVLAPWPLSPSGIESAFRGGLARGRRVADERRPEGWDGKAARRIVNALAERTEAAGQMALA